MGALAYPRWQPELSRDLVIRSIAAIQTSDRLIADLTLCLVGGYKPCTRLTFIAEMSTIVYFGDSFCRTRMQVRYARAQFNALRRRCTPEISLFEFRSEI